MSCISRQASGTGTAPRRIRQCRISPLRRSAVSPVTDSFAIAGACARETPLCDPRSQQEDVMAVDFRVNGRLVSADVPDGTRLLWVLREHLKLTGTKYGCGVAQCGACMVHIDGAPAFSCQAPIETLRGRSVTTIEGLSPDATHPLQRAWLAEQVPQCGYCQRSEEHTSELQSQSNLVCRLLLEKKKKR